MACLVEILVDEWGVQRDSDGRYVYFVLATVGGSDRGAPVCESRARPGKGWR